MIVNEKPTHPAVLGNVSQTGNFQIKNSPKAFGILSSGLYSNKVKAIIRELSCNAWDSHVQSGNSDPFDVHLPNELEPWFSVRDYGTGLSHEQIMSLYTTYFDSTKTGSNDFVGALGLGSKSPFSYTDNFTVTSVVDGWKGIYSAYIDDQGLPAIAQMSSSDTDEANGLCVSFSVKETDFYAFRDESQRVYPYFAVKYH